MTSPGPSPERATESAPESTADSQEATQLLIWRPPPPPAKRHHVQAESPVQPQRHLADLDADRNLRGVVVVVVVSVLVAAALVLTYWLTAPSHAPGPGWR